METSYLKQFDKKHGGVFIIEKGWLLFADGATRENHSLGRLMEPSADPFERAKAIVHYHEIVLKRALDHFQERKEHYKSLAEGCVQDGYTFCQADEAVEVLTKAKREVAKLRNNLAFAKRDLDALRPKKLTRQDRIKAEARDEAAEALTAIKKIRV
jgi:hypothetical protein